MPVKQLKGFTKVKLNPGESKDVCFILNKRSFAYYNIEYHDWFIESGRYTIFAAASSDDIRLSETILIKAAVIPKLKANRFTTIKELLSDSIGKEKIKELYGNAQKEMESVSEQMIENMLYEMPLASITAPLAATVNAKCL